jgi:N-acetyl-gamma-glutamyl-phosphate reductase
VGRSVRAVHPHLSAYDDQNFVDLATAATTAADVCFACLPSGSLKDLVDTVQAPLIIDLSDDFRASKEWVYGLVEHARGAVAEAARIANPGCYPTATLLGLIPFVRAGAIQGPVIVDAMSGISGAGKGLDDSLSFSALHGSASAYGTTVHRHVPEMERGLMAFGGSPLTVSFTPHLVPMARGLLVTSRAPLTSTLDDVKALEILDAAYRDEAFVTVTSEWPSTKSVLGTNRALVSARVDDRAGLLIVSAAIDNLGKGAAGQALQNANIALGLAETDGLEHVAVWP